MPRKISVACRILQRNGFNVTEGNQNDEDFYKLVAESTNQTVSAAQLRHEICRFEEKNGFYFQIFLPKLVSESTSSGDPIEKLKSELQLVNKRNQSPYPREVYAAAEFLQTEIYIFEFTGSSEADVDKLTGVVFSPLLKPLKNPDQPLLMVMTIEDGKPYFARFSSSSVGSMPFPAPVLNIDHKLCHQNRFRNTFQEIFSPSSTNQTSDLKDFFRRLSLEIYGTDQYRNLVKSMICKFEAEEDNLDVFSKFIDDGQDMSVEARRRLLSDHINRVEAWRKAPGQGELFAAASVLNIAIFKDKYMASNWDLYLPLSSNFKCRFDSMIVLREQTDGKYLPYLTNPGMCACQQKIPEVSGKIGLIKDDVYKALANKPCCPPLKRHGCHGHLRHIGGSKHKYEDRSSYVEPRNDIAMVIAKLNSEERNLDQVRGTLHECLAKEVFGDKDFVHSELQRIAQASTDLKSKIQNASDFLEVPVYVFSAISITSQSISMRHMWTCYEPRLSNQPRGKINCRFYVTLFYNHVDDEFDIVVPNTGCNCQSLPPLLMLKQNEDPEDGSALLSIAKEDRHMPRVTFLTEEPPMTLFDVEERELPPCPTYSEIRSIIQRPDMEQRTVDFVEDHSFSLFRIISKEIFGTEVRIDIILYEVCSEIKNNPEIYSTLIASTSQRPSFAGKFFKSSRTVQKEARKKNTVKAVEQIEDGLDVGDLELFAIATIFQTTIYVLSLDKTGSSFWTEYSQIRRRRKPADLQNRTLTSKCPDQSRYYITAYQATSGQYHRIVPKYEECNCLLDPPTCPEKIPFPHGDLPQNELSLLMAARTIECNFGIVTIALHNWMRCNFALQMLSEAMISEIEGRRQRANRTTIAGSTVGLISTGLIAIGGLAAPATAGLSTILMVVGGIAGGAGGLVVTGAKVNENWQNNISIAKLERCQRSLQEQSVHLEMSIAQLVSSVSTLDEKVTEFRIDQNLETFDNSSLQLIPSVLRTIKGFSAIPVGILRFSVRSATLFGLILGPLTALIDGGLLVLSAVNLYRGSKTDVSENLRRLVSVLRSSQIQMHTWAFGNRIPFPFP